MKAKFALKIFQTSDRHKFKLLFTVDYKIDGIEYQEAVMSNSFSVTSNKNKRSPACLHDGTPAEYILEASLNPNDRTNVDSFHHLPLKYPHDHGSI